MRISAFTKSYGQKTVLRFPDHELARGQIVAVIGANGSGKSTLAKVLAGVEPSDQRTRPLAGVSIGYLPQKSYGFHLSVRRNLLLNGGDRALAEGSAQGPPFEDPLHPRQTEGEKQQPGQGGEREFISEHGESLTVQNQLPVILQISPVLCKSFLLS